MAGGQADFLENLWLNYEFRSQAYTQPTNHYIGYFTVTPVDAGTGGTEVSSNAYARQTVAAGTGSWAAPAGSGTSNSGAITFPVATPAGQGLVYSLGIFDNTSGGNLKYIVPLVTSAYQAFEAVDTTAGDITARSHGFVANDRVRFFPVPNITGSALPTGITTDTRYYVIATGLTTDKFRVSATQGGSAIVYSTTGAGEVAKDGSFDVVANSQLTFAASSITIGGD